MIFLQQTLPYSLELYKVYRFSGELTLYFVVPLAIYALLLHKKFNSFNKYILLYVCFSAILEIASYGIVKFIPNTNTQFINHIYLFQETLFLGLFYKFSTDKLTSNKIYNVGIFILLLLIVWNTFYANGFVEMQSKTLFGEQLLFTFLSLLVLKQLYTNIKIKRIQQNSLFWFNLYVLTAFMMGAIFYLLLNSTLHFSDNWSMSIYAVRNFLSILLLIFVVIGINKLTPNASLKPSQQPRGRN